MLGNQILWATSNTAKKDMFYTNAYTPDEIIQTKSPTFHPLGIFE